MGKIKPITLGIIVFLLCLLSLNFIPKQEAKRDIPKELDKKEEVLSEIAPNLSQNNIELIQKNIEFIQKNMDEFKQNEAMLVQKEQEVAKQEDAKKDEEKAQEQMPKKIAQKETKQINLCKKDKPQLAIIIDDVATMEQLNAIKKLPFAITPSIFPYSEATPNGKNIAKNAEFYMVHLPLEALNFYQKNHGYLFVKDSKEVIENKVAQIKKDFPQLTYINNHTGSKFTQDKQAMTYLLDVLEKNRITFLDSKTIGNIYSPKYFATHKRDSHNICQKNPFLIRDVFLDNQRDVAKITEQLLLSVKIAKKQGYAIAIGHPYKETFIALLNAKDFLKKSGVELVYVDKLIIP